MPNPVGDGLQPATKVAIPSTFFCGHGQGPTESSGTTQPLISHFGLPPGAIIWLEQLLSCYKTLLFTFAPGRILYPWLDDAVNRHLLPVLLGG